MIDRHARNKALELIARLSTSELTNWELEDRWPKSKEDPALGCILHWLWTLYDDDESIRMREVLKEHQLAILERCRRFLESEEEFRVKRLNAEEAQNEQKKWGTEWPLGCTLPDDDHWPFSV